jgi:hypothetical protein
VRSRVLRLADDPAGSSRPWLPEAANDDLPLAAARQAGGAD